MTTNAERKAAGDRLLTIVGKLDTFLGDSPYPDTLTLDERRDLRRAYNTIARIESRLYHDSRPAMR